MSVRSSPAVDLHSHVIPRGLLDAFRQSPSAWGARIELDGAAERVVHAQGYAYPLAAEFFDPAAKIEAMDRRGLDVSVVSPAPPTFFYWADAKVALAAARLVNDGIAEMVAAHPTRLRGMATIPLQHPDMAIAELERAVRELGFRAVEIGTSVEGAALAEGRFRPVLRRCRELDVLVFAHPYYVGAKGGMESYYLTNLIGNPWDTTVMAANLMLSGALEELQGIKIALAHGGGFLPYQIGRLEHGYEVRPEARASTRTRPVELLRRFHYDSMVFNPRALRYLIDLVGSERVALGTDSPFDMGEDDPMARIGEIPGLTTRERDDVRGRTALRLLGE
ncbi:MAG: amidohydrolase family protein [Myxococcales bacterium]